LAKVISPPFDLGNRTVATRIVDDRGIENLKQWK